MQPIAPTLSVQVQAQASARPAPAPVARRADPVPQPAPVARPEPDEAQLQQAIEAANRALRQVTSDLEFARDAETGRTVMRVIDSATQQVIRQFPSEEMLAIARALDRYQGLLIRQKA